MDNNSRLAGRRILVTGAGSGIGRATAEQLAREGASLALIDARSGSAEAAASSIIEAGETAGKIWAHTVDVGDESQVRTAVHEAAQRLGGLDGVVTCAGIARTARTHELTLAEWELVIRVNLTGTFLPIRYALPHLLANPESAIVTIGSVASLVAAGGASSYDASKGGVVQFTRALAAEYATEGLRANCVCPGVVSTGLRANTEALHGHQERLRPGGEPSGRIKVPMDRRADPIEIARVVAFLCSDEASFVTGAALAVDGGYTAI